MNRFKELRKQKGITQIELAQTLGVKQTTVSKWEVDRATPDYSTLIKLAEFYGVSADYLLGIENTGITPEEYAQGARYTKKVDITADEEDILDKYREVEELFNGKGKSLIIEFCDYLLKNFNLPKDIAEDDDEDDE